MLECLKLNLEEINSLENYITQFSDNKLYSTFYFNEDKLSFGDGGFNREIYLKYTIFNNDNNIKIAIMFNLSKENPQIVGRVYDYSKESDREYLEMLLFQKEIPICITKGSLIISSYWVENDFSQGIKEYIINRNKGYKYKTLNLEIKELWYNS